MKKAIFAALALALTSGSAMAADLPSYKAPPPPPPPPIMTWTGFYAGLNFGVGFYAQNSSNAWGWGVNNHGGSRAGVVGGAQIGYNYQITPMFVVGVETDFQGTSIGSGAGGNSYAWLFGVPPVTTATLNWFGTVRGRVGVNLLSPQLLVYGTGGFAYGEVKRNGWLNQNSTVQTGWTAGGGAEYMFVALPNWSVKAEYLYTQLSGNNNNGFNFGLNLNNVNNRTRFHTIRFGVNYHFNFGSSAPVLAKY
ncbi:MULTISPECIES: outer membrane protein [unclassified Methylocystis]|uniref:outer membrane protein n=1 Tax=unclassified Methylocystis TaxID=2625913 RepID=UPI0011D65DF0|nr:MULTISPECIES: outer membrane beta-barrel protein [unclassified Methylocystis]KAF0135013.1 MAG: outer-membrane immunogenic protein [Methylocystaceae bacterium]KAF0210759.1 MAG: outer-membrane immunogenic [Methylocystaceae bacterium]MBG0792266.1 porin family protein [Methylocystis sp. H62]MDP3553767.1 outer membrane beta-barrel protein [Methylocystis sp.]TXT47255.1 MAG: outer-membrane immunogenic protein [Methylocystaceae bacterium]